jgi:hypothetical protein
MEDGRRGAQSCVYVCVRYKSLLGFLVVDLLKEGNAGLCNLYAICRFSVYQ